MLNRKVYLTFEQHEGTGIGAVYKAPKSADEEVDNPPRYPS